MLKCFSLKKKRSAGTKRASVTRHANPERELNRIHVDGNQSEKALVSVPAMSTALLEKATGADGRLDDSVVCRNQNISMKLLMNHHCALAV